jgi:hypothetical protein
MWSRAPERTIVAIHDDSIGDHMRRILIPLLATAVCAVALPAAAAAATVSTGTDHVLRYAAGMGENDALTVSASGSTVTVNDTGG